MHAKTWDGSVDNTDFDRVKQPPDVAPKIARVSILLSKD
jgi:hypothetical protein